MVVKNSEMVKDYSKMKSLRLDLLVEFDDQTTVDLEMQLRQTKDNMMNRFPYYSARLHGSQDMEGKSYSQLKETIVMIFFNVSIFANDNICNTFRYKCDGDLPFVKEEKEDRMKLRTIEMPKVDLNKPLEEMNEQEKMIYYFLNCHKGMDDSKIKVMIEKDEVIQMLEKRVETISDDRWKKIIEDFQKLHENEERMERQLELEEAQKAKEEARKVLQEANKLKQEASKLKQEVNKLKQEADKKVEEADKKVERANKQVEEANKQTELETKRADVAEKQIQDMILRLSSTMDVKAMAILLNMSVDEIKKKIIKNKIHYLWLSLFSRLALTKPTNNGCGRFGLDLNSG